MALITCNSNRRKFLRNMAGAAGAIATAGTIYPFPVSAKNKKLNLALLSDPHVPEDINNNNRGFYPYKNFKLVAAEVANSGLEGAVIAGDLARLTGEPGDYAALKELSKPIVEKMPLAMALGNHDHLNNFLDSFSSSTADWQKVKNKHVVVLDHPEIQIIILDSLLQTNLVSGLLGKAQRQWLETYLDTKNSKPTIIFVHHSLGDRDGDLLDVDKFYKIIESKRQVKAIFYGHSHDYNYTKHKDIHLINLPAIGYNFNDKDPVGWVEASFGKKGGSFTLHAIGGNMDLNGSTTELKWRS